MRNFTPTLKLFLPRKTLAVLAAGLGLAGAAMAQKAEVIHQWTSPGESAAIKEFADAYNKAGGTWVDTAITGGTAMRQAAINRIIGGNPSTAAQFNTSKQYYEVVTEGLLNDINDVAVKEKWDSFLPENIKKAVKINGKYYAMPVNIHNPGWFWYNKSVVAKAGVSAEPKSMDEFFAALDKVKASGAIPLALGGQAWQERWLFDTVMVNVGGAGLYNKFYSGKDNVAMSPEFKKVLADFKRLKGYIDPGSPGRTWNVATGLLTSGKAAYQIMGDWAKGEFAVANQTAGKEYGCFPGFGAAPPYFMDGDVFVFPRTKDAAAIAAQHKLATVMTSPAVQVAFNIKKGSIPVRPDVEMGKLDMCAQAGIAALKDAKRHLATPAQLVEPEVMGKLTDAVTKFWNSDQSVEDAQKAMAAALKG